MRRIQSTFALSEDLTDVHDAAARVDFAYSTCADRCKICRVRGQQMVQDSLRQTSLRIFPGGVRARCFARLRFPLKIPAI